MDKKQPQPIQKQPNPDQAAAALSFVTKISMDHRKQGHQDYQKLLKSLEENPEETKPNA